MWVEVISNEFCLIYGTTAFSTLHGCSLSIDGASNTPCFSSNSLLFFFLLVFQGTFFSSLFPFFEHRFRQFKLPLNDKLRVPRWRKGPMCLKHLGRSVFLISGAAVNAADQKVDQRLPGDRHLRLPPAEDRERN